MDHWAIMNRLTVWCGSILAKDNFMIQGSFSKWGRSYSKWEMKLLHLERANSHILFTVTCVSMHTHQYIPEACYNNIGDSLSKLHTYRKASNKPFTRVSDLALATTIPPDMP